MAGFDLTGQRISDTYGQLLQTDGGGNFYDGLGNPVDISTGGGGVWEDGTITRVAGLVSEITKGTKTYVVSRDGDDKISSINNGSQTITFTRIGGRVVSWSVS